MRNNDARDSRYHAKADDKPAAGNSRVVLTREPIGKRAALAADAGAEPSGLPNDGAGAGAGAGEPNAGARDAAAFVDTDEAAAPKAKEAAAGAGVGADVVGGCEDCIERRKEHRSMKFNQLRQTAHGDRAQYIGARHDTSAHRIRLDQVQVSRRNHLV